MDKIRTLFKKLTIDHVGQIVIPVLSGAAIFLLAIEKPIGHVVGIFAQPFWLQTSFKNKQWGIFALTIWFIFSYLIGIKNGFFPDLW